MRFIDSAYYLKKWQFLLIIISIAFGLNVAAQPGRLDSLGFAAPQRHPMEEFAFDSPIDPSSWSKVTAGLHASFGSTDQAYFRAEPPGIDKQTESNSWKETGWRGERVNTVIILWSPDTISQVRFKLKDLRSANGKIISAANFHLSKVLYVVSNYPYGAADATCGEGSTTQGYLMPDRLQPLEGSNDRFDIPGKTSRPVWLSIDIPAGTTADDYAGELEVRSDQETKTLRIKLRVQRQVLPAPHQWSFRLDIWQNPWVIADYYHVKPWSEDHKALLLRHLKHYADAGGKYITTYVVHSPWGDNEYYKEGGMVEWIRTSAGKWKFDYTIFDLYVQLAIKAGIDNSITVYTPLPWGERFRYKDETSGKYIYERWLPESDTFKRNWHSFLTDLQVHLKKKGWLEKTFLGVNENAMEQTLAAIKVIRQHPYKWRITYAGDWHRELDGLLDDYSSVYGKEPATDDVQKRSIAKKYSTFYICCTPPKPNTFVFSPPIEGRWLGWYTMAHGYDGMLRWAYDAWTADPTRDPRHVYWPSGDCYMVYPGANSSIRFEKMREGIVDFEKLRILKEKAKSAKSARISKILEQLDTLMQSFLGEKTFEPSKITRDVAEGRELVNALSDLLN